MLKEQLIELSKDVFSKNPKADTLIATADGNFFFPEAKGLALDYCRKNGVEHSIINKDEIVEAPVVEAPVVETPVIEAPVIEAPVVEETVVETPVVEAPVIEAPVVKASKKSKNKK